MTHKKFSLCLAHFPTVGAERALPVRNLNLVLHSWVEHALHSWADHGLPLQGGSKRNVTLLLIFPYRRGRPWSARKPALCKNPSHNKALFCCISSRRRFFLVR